MNIANVYERMKRTNGKGNERERERKNISLLKSHNKRQTVGYL